MTWRFSFSFYSRPHTPKHTHPHSHSLKGWYSTKRLFNWSIVMLIDGKSTESSSRKYGRDQQIGLPKGSWRVLMMKNQDRINIGLLKPNLTWNYFPYALTRRQEALSIPMLEIYMPFVVEFFLLNFQTKVFILSIFKLWFASWRGYNFFLKPFAEASGFKPTSLQSVELHRPGAD